MRYLSRSLGLSGLLILSGCGAGPPAAHGPPPVLNALPEFSLLADDGSPLTSARLQGHPWIASFLFTSCGSVCPTMVTKLRLLQHTLPDGVPLVSITVDPRTDTPEVLAKYAAFHQRVVGRWIFATGEWPEIETLASKGFGLGGHQRGIHSPSLGLVDAAGNLRGRYDSRDPDAMIRMVRDLALIQHTPGQAANS